MAIEIPDACKKAFVHLEHTAAERRRVRLTGGVGVNEKFRMVDKIFHVTENVQYCSRSGNFEMTNSGILCDKGGMLEMLACHTAGDGNSEIVIEVDGRCIISHSYFRGVRILLKEIDFTRQKFVECIFFDCDIPSRLPGKDNKYSGCSGVLDTP